MRVRVPSHLFGVVVALRAKFSDVSDAWIREGTYTQEEVEAVRDALRIEIGTDEGVPVSGVSGWTPLPREERIHAWAKTFNDMAREQQQ